VGIEEWDEIETMEYFYQVNMEELKIRFIPSHLILTK